MTRKTIPIGRYDCTKCPGYCCSYSRIAISDFDIERLARHFGISKAAARLKFTYHYQTKELDEQLLRHRKDHVFKSTCMFFDQDDGEWKYRNCKEMNVDEDDGPTLDDDEVEPVLVHVTCWNGLGCPHVLTPDQIRHR